MSLNARLEYTAWLRQKIIEAIGNGISESQLEELTGVARANINRIKNEKNNSGCASGVTAHDLGSYFLGSSEKAAAMMKDGYPSWYELHQVRRNENGARSVKNLHKLTPIQYNVYLMCLFDSGASYDSIYRKYGAEGKEALTVIDNKGLVECKDGVFYAGMNVVADKQSYIAIAKNHLMSYDFDNVSGKQGIMTYCHTMGDKKVEALNQLIKNFHKKFNSIMLDKTLDEGYKDTKMFRMTMMYDWLMENNNDL